MNKNLKSDKYSYAYINSSRTIAPPVPVVFFATSRLTPSVWAFSLLLKLGCRKRLPRAHAQQYSTPVDEGRNCWNSELSTKIDVINSSKVGVFFLRMYTYDSSTSGPAVTCIMMHLTTTVVTCQVSCTSHTIFCDLFAKSYIRVLVILLLLLCCSTSTNAYTIQVLLLYLVLRMLHKERKTWMACHHKKHRQTEHTWL